MAICENCFNRELCSSISLNKFGVHIIPQDECCNFKDRSRFVELPCHVGDEFFLLCENSSVFKYTVFCIDIFLTAVSIEDIYITLRSDRHNLKITKGRFIYELNQTIFYTKEAAEQALKEREA